MSNILSNHETFLLLGFLGYQFGVFIGGENEGDVGRLNFEWASPRLFGKILHIHHWFVFMIMLLLYMYYDPGNAICNYAITGFLVGGIAHGFTYNDWYQFTKVVPMQVTP